MDCHITPSAELTPSPFATLLHYRLVSMTKKITTISLSAYLEAKFEDCADITKWCQIYNLYSFGATSISNVQMY